MPSEIRASASLFSASYSLQISLSSTGECQVEIELSNCDYGWSGAVKDGLLVVGSGTPG